MRIIGNAGTAPRKVQAVASGALASGDTVVVNADGTVSVVSETGISVAQAVGSASVYESARVDFSNAAFDSSNNKIVVVYRDGGNSFYGTAVVGTVDASDNSISFGTPVVFASHRSDDTDVTFDSNANKIVICYHQNGGVGKAIVATVSGTSISFGSAASFESNGAYFTTIVFDSSNDKVVISYRDASNGRAVVGTVSGTGISFGSTAVFNSGDTYEVASTFDSTSNKVIIAYKDGANSSKGTAIVATVSGTSISFGSEAVFEQGNTDFISLAHNTSLNKTLISFRDNGDSAKGKSVVATVSGTSISFGTAAVFASGGIPATSYSTASVYFPDAQKVWVIYADAGNSDKGTLVEATISGTDVSFATAVVIEQGAIVYPGITYDSTSAKLVTCYTDTPNSQYGTSVVIQPSYDGPNLTSENFIGIASNGYATGQAATINAKGFIDDNQSSLTAGQSYYVQTNGDLGLTAADPSVFAGTAVSATKLIVKG